MLAGTLVSHNNTVTSDPSTSTIPPDTITQSEESANAEGILGANHKDGASISGNILLNGVAKTNGKLVLAQPNLFDENGEPKVAISTNTEQAQAEFKVFVENWAGCELHFLHEVAKFPLRILAAFLLTKCEGVSKELLKL